jgi:hypothetical protein
MTNRYSHQNDQFALQVLADTNDPSLPTGLAIYGRVHDRECDIAEVLVTAGAKCLDVPGPQTITRAFLISPTFSADAVRARLNLVLNATAVERLTAHLRAASAEIIVIENGQLLAPAQLRLLSRAISALQTDTDWKKKVVLLIIGRPSEYDELLQSHKAFWAIRVCPRLEEDDVNELMAKFGIEIEPNPTLPAKLLDYCRHAPHGLIALAELAQKRGLLRLTFDNVEWLIKKLDSDGHMRGKFAHLSFVSIKTARKRKKKFSGPNQLPLALH